MIILLLAFILFAPAASVAAQEQIKSPCKIDAGPAGDKAQERCAALTIQTSTNSYIFHVEIADTVKSRMRGLMGRRSLHADAGMLFEFPQDQTVQFWMKDTPLSLDMIFIDQCGNIIQIEPYTKPNSLNAIRSIKPVRFVLEILAGTSDRLAINRGHIAIHHRIKAACRRTEKMADQRK